MCKHFQVLHNLVRQYFSNKQCTMSQNHTWKKDEYKMQNRPREFNAKKHQKAASDSTLQLTFRKLLPVEF